MLTRKQESIITQEYQVVQLGKCSYFKTIIQSW